MTDNNSFESFIQDTNNMTILSEDMAMDDSSHMAQEEPEAAKELAARQLDQLDKHMEAKLCKLVGQFHELVMNGSDASVLSQAQTEIDQTSALLERLSHYRGRDTFKTPKNQTEGSTISLRDIPKFQLAGQTVKQVIRKKFDSFDRQLEMGSLVFTMQMSQHESVLDYGIHFQKACREGGVQENANLAMRFMRSLTPDLQAKVKLAWFARHTEMPQTIEQTKSTKTNAKICRHCGKDWSYNHKCKEYFSSDEYRKKQAQEFAIKSLKATSLDPMEHIANTLENVSFE
ncbi:hypothetical protein CLU79DRAFT_718760 [Phycomyces nitens]|nr:hypothetical protein CLU79DRAFT_718760 [Phycomyces nitens]